MSIKEKPKRQSNDVDEGKTLFIRNISFDTEQEDLEELLVEFGELEYCLLCIDKETGHSKGTAFAKFKSRESADKCLEAAANTGQQSLSLDGRQLNITQAISRTQAQQQASSKDTKERDKRNLYLAKEGLIYAGSPAAEGISQRDLEKRLALEHKKRKLLQNVLNFISRTRLCIHNLPLEYTDRKLRKLFLQAVNTKNAKIIEARVMRNRHDKTGKFGKSKGFGFVEFTDHAHALTALRKLNNNPDTFTAQARPIVEFAVANHLAVNKKEKQAKIGEKLRQEALAAKQEGSKVPVPQEKSGKNKKRKKNQEPANDESKEATEEPTEEKQKSPKSKKPKLTIEQNEDNNSVDPDNEQTEISYTGLKAKPLGKNEKVVPPKLNRKMIESKKQLRERKKQLLRQEKAAKVRAEHQQKRERKNAERKSRKSFEKEKDSKKEETDLDKFEAKFISKRAKLENGSRNVLKKKRGNRGKVDVKKQKWFESNE